MIENSTNHQASEFDELFSALNRKRDMSDHTASVGIAFLVLVTLHFLDVITDPTLRQLLRDFMPWAILMVATYGGYLAYLRYTDSLGMFLPFHQVHGDNGLHTVYVAEQERAKKFRTIEHGIQDEQYRTACRTALVAIMKQSLAVQAEVLECLSRSKKRAYLGSDENRWNAFVNILSEKSTQLTRSTADEVLKAAFAELTAEIRSINVQAES